MTVCCESNVKQINTLCDKNTELLILRLVEHLFITGLQMVNMMREI